MTKAAGTIAILLLVASVGLLVVGIPSETMSLMMVSLLCTSPAFLALAGFAIGRATNEYVVVERQRPVVQRPQRRKARPTMKMPDDYEVIG